MTTNHEVVSAALLEGGYIASSGGSPDGPSGPDLIVAATGEVLAVVERSPEA